MPLKLSWSLSSSTQKHGTLLRDRLLWQILQSSLLIWSGDTCITLIAKSTAKVVGKFYHSRNYLASNVLLYLYNSQIWPWIEYCCHLWAGSICCCFFSNFLRCSDELHSFILSIWEFLMRIYFAASSKYHPFFLNLSHNRGIFYSKSFFLWTCTPSKSNPIINVSFYLSSETFFLSQWSMCLTLS